MDSRMQKNVLLRINLALAFLSSLLALWFMTREPSETQAAVIGGFSLPRLLIISIIILFLSVATWLFIVSLRRNFWSSRVGDFITKVFFWKTLPFILLLLLAVFYFILLSSPQLLGDFLSYRQRLFSLFVWLAILVLQVFITVLVVRWSEASPLKLFQGRFKGTLVALGILGFLVLFIALSRIGLTPDVVYWMEPGVPLMIQQVLVALGIGAIFLILQKQGDFISRDRASLFKKLVDSKLFLCLLIWGVASALWLSQPLRPAYNSLPALAPNFQRYPFGDAMYYDIHAQSMLIGKPIPSHFWVKPLYTLFLSGLHGLAGQDYALIVSLQVIVLAIIPVLGYLILDTMGNRTAGLILATLIIFRERNAIALSNVIQVSNSKLLMSDVFSMGLMALLTLLLVRWGKDPVAHRSLPLAAGGALGLLVLARGNPVVLFPFLVFFVLFVVYSQKKLHLWREALLFLLMGLMVPLAPWFIRNYQLTGKLAFQDAPETYTMVLANLYDQNPSTDYGALLPSEVNVDHEAEPQNQMFQYILRSPGDVVQFVSAHYFHNLIFSYIYLPQSFQIENTRSLVKDLPFWGTWKGHLPGDSKALLVLNLGVLALGLSALWKKNSAFVLAPVLMILGYNLSVAVVRLSGWRLILPFDWLTLIFYSMGLVQVMTALFSVFAGERYQEVDDGLSRERVTVFKWWMPVLLGLVFGIIGFGVTKGNTIFRDQYAETTTQQLLQKYNEIFPQSQVVLTPQDLQDFIKLDGAIAIHGRALFPTFLSEGAGYQSVYAPAFDQQPFNRLAFFVTGSQDIGGIIPLNSPPKAFPGFSDLIVFGCHVNGRYGDYVDALAVVLASKPATVYVRSSLPEQLTCPLPPP